MNLKTAYEILRSHQKWRRGSDSVNMQNPTDLGKAIDVALKVMEMNLSDPEKIDNKKSGDLLDFFVYLHEQGWLNHFVDYDFKDIVNEYMDKIRKSNT